MFVTVDRSTSFQSISCCFHLFDFPYVTFLYVMQMQLPNRPMLDVEWQLEWVLGRHFFPTLKII